jgi:thymidylate synthase
MHFKYRNINDAFDGFVYLFNFPRPQSSIQRRLSRNGGVLVVDEPVLATYSHPMERVLFNRARDANPFFHLYHSLWMLVGRQDVAPLTYYNRRMAEFSDDGETLNGAYGYRWRYIKIDEGIKHIRIVDQLKLLIDHLKSKPNSRRAVLQMWNVEDDLLRIDSSKDVCCNLSVMFSLREVECDPDFGDVRTYTTKVLDMTVANRSNDMVWGMLGEDYMTFSVLQEYVAAHLEVQVGVYNHFTNNLHVYLDNWRPEEWLRSNPGFLANSVADWGAPYPTKLFPLVEDPAVFDREIVEFIERHNRDSMAVNYKEPFLQ